GACKNLSAAAGQEAKWLWENMLSKGYGTNYMTHWFLVRGGPRLKLNSGNHEYPVNDSATPAYYIKALNGTIGPISRNIIDNSPHTSARIPLMGCSNIGDAGDGILEESIVDDQ